EAVARQSSPHIFKPIKSFSSRPRFSPRIVIFIPGQPTRGDIPVTRGGAI
ncbi:unnamed protein product, partial [Rotaria sp. Silwood2]